MVAGVCQEQRVPVRERGKQFDYLKHTRNPHVGDKKVKTKDQTLNSKLCFGAVVMQRRTTANADKKLLMLPSKLTR